MRLKINTQKVPTKALENINGVTSAAFPTMVQNDNLPIEIDILNEDGTLPYFWGSAEYAMKLSIGDIATRLTYCESNIMTPSNGLYTGTININSSALIGALVGNMAINVDVQVAVSSYTGMLETILLTNSRVLADSIS